MLQGKLQSGIGKLNSSNDVNYLVVFLVSLNVLIFSVAGHNRISNPGIFQVFTASLFSTFWLERSDNLKFLYVAALKVSWITNRLEWYKHPLNKPKVSPRPVNFQGCR